MAKKMTFEQANEKLEQTVKNLENNSLILQESVEQYAQACELLAYCMNELETCKGQIEDINERINRLHNKGGDLFED